MKAVWKSTKLWWLTAFCAAVAIGLFALSSIGRGPKIVVHFEEGHGLKPGDALRYHGIDVGRVTRVRMDDALEGVDVTIRLQETAASVAREGSRWMRFTHSVCSSSSQIACGSKQADANMLIATHNTNATTAGPK